jgi:uncharacterized protein (TIGR02147 family)
MDSAKKKPFIYEYTDYRKYLSDLFLFQKSISDVFSHRYIIQKAGFSSPTMLKNVVLGKRHLSLSAARRFSSAFGMDRGERRFFLLLVRFATAKTLPEKEKCHQAIERIKGKYAIKRINDDYYDVLDAWWHLAIREVVALPDAKSSSKWIARALQPNITPKEAAHSLRLLRRLGLIRKINEQWQPAESAIQTDPTVVSVKAANFHRQMIQLGGESVSRFPADQREISGTTLRIAKRDIAKFKELLRAFRSQLLNLAQQSPAADAVYQLNYQFFPLVKLDRPRRLKVDGRGAK